jgi:hypothetical protein
LIQHVMPQKSRPESPRLTNVQNSLECAFLERWWSRADALAECRRKRAPSCCRSGGSSDRGLRTVMFVVPVALAACWRKGSGVARRSESVAQRRAGLSAASQVSSLGRPPRGGLVSFELGQGGRLGVRGSSASGLPKLSSLCEAGKVHLVRRCWLMHNTSLKRSAIGRPPVPGLLHAKHSHRPGPVVPPLSSA